MSKSRNSSSKVHFKNLIIVAADVSVTAKTG